MNAGSVTVSIVSHGHGAMLPALITDLSSCPEIATVVVTRNLPEPPITVVRAGWQRQIDNAIPKGFGANHNAALRGATTPFVAVLNPDVRLDGNPFPALLESMRDGAVALCAPAVVSPGGALEDSARRFPSLFDLALKAFGRYDGRLQYDLGDPPMMAPWVAGMFMLVRSSDYAALGGFDEDFFLYYEDVDLCARLWQSGRHVTLCPAARVVHNARRASHYDMRHMRWHVASMARYFRKHALHRRTPVA